MPHHFLGHPRVWIRVLAQRIGLRVTRSAVSARDGEGDHDPVAHVEVLHFTSNLNHLAHEFVTQYVAFLQRRYQSVVQMQIRATDRSRSDFYDRVTLVEDLGIRDLLDAHIALAVPTICSH